MPNTPACPHESCCHRCPLIRQSYFFVKFEFQSHLHLRQVFYLFYCLEKKRNECPKKKRRKRSPELPFKKEEQKCKVHEASHVCVGLGHAVDIRRCVSEGQQGVSERTCPMHVPGTLGHRQSTALAPGCTSWPWRLETGLPWTTQTQRSWGFCQIQAAWQDGESPVSAQTGKAHGAAGCCAPSGFLSTSSSRPARYWHRNFQFPLNLDGIPVKLQPHIQTPHFCKPKLYNFFCERIWCVLFFAM